MTEQQLYDEAMRRIRHEGECWVWTAGLNRRAPLLQVGGRNLSARRIIFQRFSDVSKMPASGIGIKATCGNSRCVRPAHCAPKRRLSDKDVRYIRRSTEPISLLAKSFGVTKQAISGVKRGKTHKWV